MIIIQQYNIEDVTAQLRKFDDFEVLNITAINNQGEKLEFQLFSNMDRFVPPMRWLDVSDCRSPKMDPAKERAIDAHLNGETLGSSADDELLDNPEKL